MNVKERVTDLARSCISNFSVVEENLRSHLLIQCQIMLAPKKVVGIASLNSALILPAICCFFVLLVFISESSIKLCASSIGGNRIFFG